MLELSGKLSIQEWLAYGYEHRGQLAELNPSDALYSVDPEDPEEIEDDFEGKEFCSTSLSSVSARR